MDIIQAISNFFIEDSIPYEEWEYYEMVGPFNGSMPATRAHHRVTSRKEARKYFLRQYKTLTGERYRYEETLLKDVSGIGYTLGRGQTLEGKEICIQLHKRG